VTAIENEFMALEEFSIAFFTSVVFIRDLFCEPRSDNKNPANPGTASFEFSTSERDPISRGASYIQKTAVVSPPLLSYVQPLLLLLLLLLQLPLL
jgi:hypothetical protein